MRIQFLKRIDNCKVYGRIGTIFGILPILHLGRRHKWVNPLMVKN